MARRGARVRDQRRQHRRRRLAMAFGLALGLAAVAGTGVGVRMLLDPTRFPIRNVRVEGRFLFLEQRSLERLVAPELGDGFFGLDVRRLQRAVETHPWVASASVRRAWPDGVVLAVRERQPVARWGEGALVDGDGVVFTPPSLDGVPELVRLDGPPDTAPLVLARYRALEALFARHGERVAAVRLSPRGAWQVRLGSGVQLLLGRRAVDDRLRRLSAALAAGLAGELPSIERIDLRYGNGMALRYRAQRLRRWPDGGSRA